MLAGLVWVRKCMWVKFTQTKNGLFGLVLPLDEVDRSIGNVVVDRNHPRFGQRAGIRAHLLADLAETRIDGLVVPSEALQSITPRGPYFARNDGSFG